jgi:hypothetical protein
MRERTQGFSFVADMCSGNATRRFVQPTPRVSQRAYDSSELRNRAVTATGAEIAFGVFGAEAM